MASCAACGSPLGAGAAFCPQCGAPQGAGVGDGVPRTFANSVSLCLRKYAVFAGRAPRAEFWWFVLFGVLVNVAARIIGAGAGGVHGAIFLETLAGLFLLLPSLSVQVRRLHDLDRAGGWWWLGLIPVVGWIVLLIWACTPGTPGPNRFGMPNGEPG